VPGLAPPTGFLDHPRPLAFAHRGGAGHFPENSWRAFQHAVELGYAYLETDAHATADGVVVAFHDKRLDRVTDAAGAIARLPWAQVAAARIDGAEPIPLLADLIGAWPDVRFNIDIKDDPAVAPVAEVVRRTAAWDRVCLVSFSGRRLAAVRRLLDRPVCTATSPAEIAMLRYGTGHSGQAERFARLGTGCAQVPAGLVTPRFLRRAHAAGLQVHAWTVNEAAEMARLLDLGADGIMTDNTVTLREVLQSRGGWHPRPGALPGRKSPGT
jgi:glycerophosphoryl diester phosphodiesterase